MCFQRCSPTNCLSSSETHPRADTELGHEEIEAAKFTRTKEEPLAMDSSLNRPVPKPIKILVCDWAQKYFCAQSESSHFHVTFVTSYSKVFTEKLFDHLFAIEFPSMCFLVGRGRRLPYVAWNASNPVAN